MTEVMDVTVLMTALFAGLLGSGHCFGMCGGIAVGLGHLSKQGFMSALVFNLGRLLSYACLGALSAWLLAYVGGSLNVPQWGMILRLLTALMILLIGLQFLFGWQFLGFIERAGAHVWKKILPLAVKASTLPGGMGRLLLGLCWGLLPCGLVYSVLLTSSASGDAISGAAVMLAFGVGTLPSMLGMSMAAPALSRVLADKWTRKLMGFALVMLAILSVSLLVAHQQSGHQHGQSHEHGASDTAAHGQEHGQDYGEHHEQSHDQSKTHKH